VNKGGRIILEIKLESLTKGGLPRLRLSMLSPLSEQRSGRIYAYLNNKVLRFSDIPSLSKVREQEDCKAKQNIHIL